MSFRSVFSLATLLQIISASPVPGQDDLATRAQKPPAFLLAGDSTTAIQSEGGGGWGVGFLSTLKNQAWGIDYGHNGATTVSFVKGGDWAKVLKSVQNSTADYDVWVTIQFGHNDQKPKAGISLSEYQTNLENFAAQVKKAGATPLLVTPLTRRSFKSEHVASDSLAQQRVATIAAATKTSTKYIDLNQASRLFVDSIGKEAAQVYDLHGTDQTHLNDYGSVVFGNLVADLILGHAPNLTDPDFTPAKGNVLAQYIKPNQTLTHEIWSGVATT